MVFTESKKWSSKVNTPCPLHLRQAPFELKLNNDASECVADANSFRIKSNTPINVAAFALEDLPIGDWSIRIASGCSLAKHS